MKSWTLALAFLLPLMACTHTPKETREPAAKLHFADEHVKVEAYWQSQPTVEPEQFLRLEVRDEQSGELVKSPKDLSVSVWTKTHSYGLVEPTVRPAKDEAGKDLVGVYDVSGIYFLAKGKWEVRVYMNEGRDPNPMQKFVVDLGEEAINPMDDPNSPMYKMMKKTGMDHRNHQGMNHGNAEGEKEKIEKKEVKPGS